MRRLVHRTLLWIGPAAATTFIALVGLAFGAAQVWPNAKAWDERQWRFGLSVMTAPTFLALAALLVAGWAYALWKTRPWSKQGIFQANMTGREFAHYMLKESAWGWTTQRFNELGIIQGKPTPMKLKALLMVSGEFQRFAQTADSPVRAFGTMGETTVGEAIPHAFWIANTLSQDSIILPNVSETDATVLTWHDKIVYTNVRIGRAGVIQAWPRRNLIRRILSKIEQRRESTRWERTQV